MKNRILSLVAGLALALTGSLSAKDTWYVSDHLATTVASIDVAGEIAQIEADAFGTPLSHDGTIGNPERYTGKPYDEDLGAYVFPFRNYRPEEGRWMSADPSGFPDGMNSQRYAAIVTLQIDPYGLVLDTNNSTVANSAVNEIKKDPVGKTIIEQLQKSTSTYIIRTATEELVTSSFLPGGADDGNISIIRWNPDSGVSDASGNTINALTTLFHEMTHAYNFDTDPTAYTNRTNSLLPGWLNAEEKYVIENFEHPYVDRHPGQGKRTNHEGFLTPGSGGYSPRE
jgi:RHS repeat-associated protein